ncbi:DUF3102 domain-containing protein [Leptospira adleri]|uniref:DUF3102 domain-containing protein n=1 Tax=Leptospira adleri TaxID=2023186 RepID=A0A2M9YJE3_9LEPT|nr:DUF3102 domain-containing protein [Leptospira adleri]PJZ51624.1 hypothetical protein CH380_19455 [Leptospira adleri]PJZ61867.1 hypothetical protein CH376_10710 [Leptospira adleri]
MSTPEKKPTKQERVDAELVKTFSANNEKLPAMSSSDEDPALTRLKEAYASVISAQKRTIKVAIEFGAILYEVKQQLNHGDWSKYIEDNYNFLKFGTRVASSYMRIYDYRDRVGECRSIREADTLIQSIIAGELPGPTEKEINPPPKKITPEAILILRKRLKKEGKSSLKKREISELKKYLDDIINSKTQKFNDSIKPIQEERDLLE